MTGGNRKALERVGINFSLTKKQNNEKDHHFICSHYGFRL
jgi:hypothetical protein